MRSRPLTAMALAFAVAGIAAGCASPGSGIQAGEHVTIYVSMPLRGAEAADGRDVVDAARLALADAHGKVGQLGIRAKYLDDTAGHGKRARWSPAAAAANARRATEDSTGIAYIGDFDSGGTRSSLPITNEARMLQVSPAATAVDLVQPYLGAGDQLPSLQHTGERTFGRVIPSDEVQGEAGAAWAKRLGARSVATVTDGSVFGRTIAASFHDAAGSLSRAPASHADVLYYGGGPIRIPVAVHRNVLNPCSPQTLIASDALLDAPILGRRPSGVFNCPALPASGPGSHGVLLTAAAEDPSQLPPAGQRFVRNFRRRYHRAPGRYAAYGYEAMAVVLDSIRRAGSGGDNRDSVVSAFFDTRDRRSVLGTYSIDDVGNTTLNRLAGYRLVKGRPRFSAALRVGP